MSINSPADAPATSPGCTRRQPPGHAGLGTPHARVAGRAGLRTAAVVDLSILLASLLPLLAMPYLPLADLPNHLASQSILWGWADSALLREYYAVRFGISPNLAFETFTAATRGLLSFEAAARVFCILALTGIFVGVRAINLALGAGRTRVYRFTPFLLYAGPFQFGFLNYWFGVGAALLALAGWLRFRQRPAAQVVPTFLLVGLLVLACHLAAFGLFAIAVAAFELAAAVERARTGHATRRPLQVFLLDLSARAGRSASFLLPPLAVFALVSTPSGSAGEVVWGTLQQKVEAVAAITLFAKPSVELALLACALLGTAVASWTRAIRLHPAAWPLVIFMVAAFLVLPRSLNNTGWLDYRIPSGAALFILACMMPADGTRARRLLRWWFGALAVVRVVSITVLWGLWQPTLASADAAFQMMPTGARLAVVGAPGSTSASRQPPLWNIGGLAVVRRQAFVPHLFASAGSMVRYQPAWTPLHTHLVPQRIDRLAPVYDHLLVLDPQRTDITSIAGLQPLVQHERFHLYQVRR